MTPPIAAWIRNFNHVVFEAAVPLFRRPVSSAEPDISRLWNETQNLALNSSHGEALEGRIRQNLEQVLFRYQSLDSEAQSRFRPMAVLSWAQIRLLDGDTEGVLNYLRAQQRQTPELGQIEPIHALLERLEQRQQLYAGQFISQIAHLAVQIDIENRLPHTRWWNRSQIESRLRHWAQGYQSAVQSGENPLAAFERLKPEFLRISDSLGQVLNEEGLWNRIGSIASHNSVAGMEMQLMDLASRWGQTHPALAGTIYQSLRESTFAREAQEAQARLGGEASRFLRNLTPWTAESHRAFAMNLLTVGAFVGTGWIGAGVRGATARSLASLLGAERAATVGGRFLIGSGQWLAGTVTSAALLPILTHGGEPFAEGTYFREFGHNLVFSGFLGLSGAWTHAVRNVAARSIAAYVSAIGGMAAFDLWTQPALRREHPLELTAYFVAQDALGRAGHQIGERGRELAHRTILDQTWQNRVQARLEHWRNSPPSSASELATRVAPAALGLAIYALDRFSGLHLLDGAEAFMPMIGMAGGRRSSSSIVRDCLRTLNSGKGNQASVLQQLMEALEGRTRSIAHRDLESLTETLRPLTEHEDLEVCRKALDVVIHLLMRPELERPIRLELSEILQNAIRSNDPDLRGEAIKASLTLTPEGHLELVESGSLSALEFQEAVRLHLDFLRENPYEYEATSFNYLTLISRVGLLGADEFDAIDSILETRRDLLSVPTHLDEYMMREFRFPPPSQNRQPVASFLVDNFMQILSRRNLDAGNSYSINIHQVDSVADMAGSLLENRTLAPSYRVRVVQQAIDAAFQSRHRAQILRFLPQLSEHLSWANAQELAQILNNIDTGLQGLRDQIEPPNDFLEHIERTYSQIANRLTGNAQAAQIYEINRASVQLSNYWQRAFANALRARLREENSGAQSTNNSFRLAAWWALVHLSEPANQPRNLETLVNLILASGIVSPERLPPLALSLFGNVASFKVIRQISSLIFGQLEDPQSLLDAMVLGLGEAQQSRNLLEVEERRLALQAFLEPLNDSGKIDRALIHWSSALESSTSETFRIGLHETLDAWLRGEEQENGSFRILVFDSVRNAPDQLRLWASRLLDLINGSASNPSEQRELLERFLGAYLPRDFQAWQDWSRRASGETLSESESLFEEIRSVLTALHRQLPLDDRFQAILEFLRSTPQG